MSLINAYVIKLSLSKILKWLSLCTQIYEFESLNLWYNSLVFLYGQHNIFRWWNLKRNRW